MTRNCHVPFHLLLALIVVPTLFAQGTGLHLNKKEYFEAPGINVMAFQDIYPDGHQGGVSIIQNGVRVATNGDVRLDPAPGQWRPMPKQDAREVDAASNTIATTLSYPDPTKNRTGFNPIDYPDLNFTISPLIAPPNSDY
jgi:endoglucanase